METAHIVGRKCIKISRQRIASLRMVLAIDAFAPLLASHIRRALEIGHQLLTPLGDKNLKLSFGINSLSEYLVQQRQQPVGIARHRIDGEGRRNLVVGFFDYNAAKIKELRDVARRMRRRAFGDKVDSRRRLERFVLQCRTRLEDKIHFDKFHTFVDKIVDNLPIPHRKTLRHKRLAIDIAGTKVVVNRIGSRYHCSVSFFVSKAGTSAGKSIILQ